MVAYAALPGQSVIPTSRCVKIVGRFATTPRGMKVHADFMHDVGTLKNKAESWKDLFWENMWSKDGS